ncbi:beta-galactoside alpha-2,6-sialyltransferase 2 [Leptonychotes weddellii]|uniref:Beta-galactoside alpha-2,6-sialyltransferase 2 n=1 Tax=Leptonychotes weddellii TaxID=9713 RepID=A0A7F8QA24_LEPWE|nr:beta-galactoside alpha-2,6-sialyltransferase 2 [Leptonychotes weddellii]
MKPHLKQWRQRMLCGIFAWGLLFVVMFIYFTDSNPAEPAPSSFSFLETRRLLPMQGKQRAIMGAAQEPSLLQSVGAHKGLLDGRPSGPFHRAPGDLSQWAQVQDGFESDEEFFSSPIGRKSQSAFYPEDDDYFFAAGQPGLQSHTQGTPGALSPRDQGRSEGAAPARQAQRRRAGKRQRKAGGSLVLEHGDDGDRLYSSMSRAFLHRLWKGNVSSKMLNPRLQKAMQDYLSANKHGVRFRGRRAAGLSRAELLCALRSRVRVRTLDGKEAPFSALGWQKLVPAVPLSQLHPRGLRSCAVVMSAGAILNSSLGEEIGKELTVFFASDKMQAFNHELGTEPKFLYPMHSKAITETSAASNFLPAAGILIMMSLCSEVHVYEYIPSVRQTELCHYHELYYDAACTLGAYHPLLYEKLLVQRLNTGALGDLHRKGKVVLPGLRAVRCPAPNPAGPAS